MIFQFPLRLALALGLILQPLAFASPSSQEANEALLEKIENYDVNNMSLEELKAALDELNTKLTELELDLRTAEIMADGRVAVTVRNWTMTIGAAAIALLVISDIRCKGPDCGGGLVSAFLVVLPLTLVSTAAEQGYIFLTSGELHELQRLIPQIKQKISDLAWKIHELE